ncbi:MAG: DNA polymerase I, partial [Clostridia bacterium]|nr:DNA polymerase I [Clostridia bacterium]
MKLMAIDGNSLINRAFYGVRPLSNKDGVPTNAIYGFLNMYYKLLGDLQPDGVCVCFDLKAKTFRHKMYDGYKAQRKPMPEDLAVQVPLLKECLDLMGVPRMEMEGFEADDLLGTLARICHEAGDSCTIVTGDRDSLQFIAEGADVALVTTRMGQTTTEVFDADKFAEAYQGLSADKIVDLKAIMGDKSDNIPGIPGIGEKGAMDLLVRFGSLQSVYDN